MTSEADNIADPIHRQTADRLIPPLVDPLELLTCLAADRRKPSTKGERPCDGIAGTLPRDPLLLDVRWTLAGGVDRCGFAAAHLPGAVLVDLDADLAGPPGVTVAASVAGRGGRHPLPTPAMLQGVLRRLRVDRSRPVVVYDAADSMAAARAWWVLRFAGLTDVRVLDGGLRAWIRIGGPVESGDPFRRSTGDVVLEPGGKPVGGVAAGPGGMPVLDAAGAARVATTGVLLDARPENRFHGEGETIDPVPGHIPGARSAPAGGSLAPDGSFLPAAELRDRFAALGVPTDPAGGEQPMVGAYCGSGVTAAHEVLALAIAGVPAALYVGSWSDWILDPGRPVRTG